ncbi:unnamed protein product [Vitrella brassicaformis CCMP3155]|uniref:WD40 repeat-like protein n=3 Tax=Vitrella brassicaformis TaxID=1169539 RepID=A0A0G4G9R1_VITBC|nr:unnamed protein product [Vitrella brassicaformis CCMP3155]|eukprot:CEM25720.1 unnamed protein product [Vitrella brassicaformis CCMP3155]
MPVDHEELDAEISIEFSVERTFDTPELQTSSRASRKRAPAEGFVQAASLLCVSKPASPVYRVFLGLSNGKILSYQCKRDTDGPGETAGNGQLVRSEPVIHEGHSGPVRCLIFLERLNSDFDLPRITDDHEDDELAGMSRGGHNGNPLDVSPSVAAQRSDKGGFLLSGGSDRVIKVWELSYHDDPVGRGAARCLQTLYGHGGSVLAMASSVFGGEAIVASCSTDQHIMLWKMDPDKRVLRFPPFRCFQKIHASIRPPVPDQQADEDPKRTSEKTEKDRPPPPPRADDAGWFTALTFRDGGDTLSLLASDTSGCVTHFAYSLPYEPAKEPARRASGASSERRGGDGQRRGKRGSMESIAGDMMVGGGSFECVRRVAFHHRAIVGLLCLPGEQRIVTHGYDQKVRISHPDTHECFLDDTHPSAAIFTCAAWHGTYQELMLADSQGHISIYNLRSDEKVTYEPLPLAWGGQDGSTSSSSSAAAAAAAAERDKDGGGGKDGSGKEKPDAKLVATDGQRRVWAMIALPTMEDWNQGLDPSSMPFIPPATTTTEEQQDQANDQQAAAASSSGVPADDATASVEESAIYDGLNKPRHVVVLTGWEAVQLRLVPRAACPSIKGHSGAVVRAFYRPLGCGERASEREKNPLGVSGHLYSASSDNTIKCWDVENQLCLRTFRTFRSEITEFLFLPSTEMFLTGHESGDIKMWNVDDMQSVTLKTPKGQRPHKNTISSMALLVTSPSAKKEPTPTPTPTAAAAAAAGGPATYRSAESLESDENGGGDGDAASSVSSLPVDGAARMREGEGSGGDGVRSRDRMDAVVVGSFDCYVSLWKIVDEGDTITARMERSFRAHPTDDDELLCLCVSSCHPTAPPSPTSPSQVARNLTHRSTTSNLSHRLTGHGHHTDRHSPSTVVLTGGNKGVIYCWMLPKANQPERLLFQLAGHQDAVTSLIEVSGRLFSGSEDGTVRIWLLTSSSTQGARESAPEALGQVRVPVSLSPPPAAKRLPSRLLEHVKTPSHGDSSRTAHQAARPNVTMTRRNTDKGRAGDEEHHMGEPHRTGGFGIVEQFVAVWMWAHPLKKGSEPQAGTDQKDQPGRWVVFSCSRNGEIIGWDVLTLRIVWWTRFDDTEIRSVAYAAPWRTLWLGKEDGGIFFCTLPPTLAFPLQKERHAAFLESGGRPMDIDHEIVGLPEWHRRPLDDVVEMDKEQDVGRWVVVGPLPPERRKRRRRKRSSFVGGGG